MSTFNAQRPIEKTTVELEHGQATLPQRQGQELLVGPPSQRSAGLRRVLFLTHHFPPDGNAPASRVHEMCRRWVEAGYDVTVITSTPGEAKKIDGIDVVRVWSPFHKATGSLARATSYLMYLVLATVAALFVRRPDMLIATSPQIFCGLTGILVKFLRRVPLVLEIRDIWPASISAVGLTRSPWLLRPLEWMEQMMYRRATHIVTVGEGYRQQLVSRCAPLAKVSVITNGVDATLYEPQAPAPELLAKHGLEGKFVVAVVGTIGLASGLDVVLRASRELRSRGRDDVAFLLVGDGAVRKNLESQAAAGGIDNVVFAGRQPKSLMPAYLASVDVCLVHLRRTGVFQHVLPSKIFEAAAMQRPIILGVDGFAATLVEESGGGLLIEPEQADQLADAVERLAGDPELAARLGAAGREFVLQNYNRDQLAEDYLDVLDSVWKEVHAS